MTLRQDGINPRTGMVVALCSIFLVFGFMFTVSGIKGETLGDVPLIAVGPAICLPGVAAIILANKTKGCVTWPWQCRWPQRAGGPKASPRAAEPWEGEICAGLEELQGERQGRSGEDSVSTTTTVGESSRLIRRVEQDEVLSYLRTCYPSSTFVTGQDVSVYCPLDRLCSPRNSEAYTLVPTSSVVHVPRESIVVYSARDSNPYGPYCCYINPQDFRWDSETMV